MQIFFGWILFALVVGLVGQDRKIGFLASFILSLVLSPVIGLIIVLLSKSKKDMELEKEMAMSIHRQSEAIERMSDQKSDTYIDQLYKLKNLYDSKMISLAEFEEEKRKLEIKKKEGLIS